MNNQAVLVIMYTIYDTNLKNFKFILVATGFQIYVLYIICNCRYVHFKLNIIHQTNIKHQTPNTKHPPYTP